jgi:hypothetical protein
MQQTACFVSQAAIICLIVGWVMPVASALRRPCGQCASALHCSRLPPGMQRHGALYRITGLARASAAALPENARLGRRGLVRVVSLGLYGTTTEAGKTPLSQPAT